MVDYTKPTGSGGIMLIKDLGSTVEFYIQAGSVQTNANGKTWSWAANGTGNSGVYNYPTGKQFLKLGSITVSSTQNITFSIGATGTSGLGGPTSFVQMINRSGGIPPAPTGIGVDTETLGTFRYVSKVNGDGGSPILGHQIGYGEDPVYIQKLIDSEPIWTVTGLKPNTTYYVWSRNRNAFGWSPWSNRITTKTIGGGRVKRADKWRNSVPYGKIGGKWKIAQPYVKVAGKWKPTD